LEPKAQEVSSLEKANIKIMARNREAYHEYFVEEEYEAGIELMGTEVKSIRAGTLNLKDAWCGIKDGEILLNQMHISPYDHGNRFNPDHERGGQLHLPRRLWLGRLRYSGKHHTLLHVLFRCIYGL
jgi:SsrA-binding protein